MVRAVNWRLVPRTEESIKAFFGPPEAPNPAGRCYQRLFTLDLTPQPVDSLVGELREAEVMTVFSALDNESTYGHRVEPEFVADLARRFPDCFVPFAGADPHKGSRAVEALERSVREFGFKGVDLSGSNS